MPTELLILEDSDKNCSSTDHVTILKSSREGNPARQHVCHEFEQAYQHSPQYVARAPGRVNIIGEHIDYNGFGVLPMALEQSIFVACSTLPRNENEGITLHIQSTSPGAEPRQYTYQNNHHLREKASPPFDATDRDWSHYVLCAFFGVLEELSTPTKQWTFQSSQSLFLEL